MAATFAGGGYYLGNKSYYIYNNDYQWTMTPMAYIKWVGTNWNVYWEGSFTDAYPNNYSLGLRSVVSLKSNTSITGSGNGCISSPYIVNAN